ncbi:MAG: S41 family peptidase [Bdellovibrionota bacterium]
MRWGLESLGIMLIRIVIALGAISIAAPEMAFASDWDSTNLSTSSLEEYVNTERCYKNPDEFLGCIAAMNSLLREKNKVLSNNQIKNLASMKQTVLQIGPILIKNYEAPLVDFKSADSWEKFKVTNIQINNSWKQFYFSTIHYRLNIDQLLKETIALSQINNNKAKIGKAINAFYSASLDPHTYILPKVTWDATYAKSEEKLIGAGVYVKKLNEQYILQPMEDGSAERSGIKNLDALLKVDGRDVSNLGQEEVVALIRGVENTTVTLTVERKKQPVDIQVVRTAYQLKNIHSKILSDPLMPHKKIGYIKIARFNVTGVCTQFINAATNLRRQGAEVLILDLRSNGGGSVSEAVCIAEMYIDKNKIIVTKRDPATGEVIKEAGLHKSTKDAPLFNLYGKKPLYILQNADSASASELLAGSLVTYGRAIVIGERSFGKGTLQRSQNSFVTRIFTGMMMMKTVARFHFANGTSNQLHGIQPDILVHSKPDAKSADYFALREADLYPNVIVAAKAPVTFPKFAIDKINLCIKTRNMLSTEYSNPSSEVALDYQLLVAREAASCSFGRE